MARDGYIGTAGVSVSATQDFAEVGPASNKPTRLMGRVYAQSSDLGDAQEEVLRTAVRRGNTTSGSGGTTPTATPADRNDTSPGYAPEMNNTTKATSSGATLVRDGYNIRLAPVMILYPDAIGPYASAADTTMCDELVAAPADAVTQDTSEFIREY